MPNVSTLLSPLTVLIRPGPTVRGLIERKDGQALAWVVAAAFGLVQSGRAYLSAPSAEPAILFIGAALGVAGLYFFAWLLRNFSRWFGGSSELRDVRTGFGLALLPWTVLFAALLFSMPSTAGAEEMAEYFKWFIAAFLYGYIILLLATAAALRLSVLKAFLVLVVSALVSFFPITLIAQLISVLMG